MLITIPDLLHQAQIDKINEVLSGARFVDGKLTAGKHAVRVKNNLELAPDTERKDLLNRIIMSALGHSAVFRSAVLPLKVADPIISRYTAGMSYGDHVDDPIMGGNGPKFRTDISMTLFLRNPDSYDGGELVIHTPMGDQTVKLPAGHAVIYPSSSLHRVAEVTSGERVVALAWVQSFVKDPLKRELLYELDQAREWMLQQHPDESATSGIDRSYVNLLRRWSEL